MLPPLLCVCVSIVVQAECQVAPNKNLTMSLFLISPSFRPYNVVFISGGSVEGFCLRLRYINPGDIEKKDLFFHLELYGIHFSQQSLPSYVSYLKPSSDIKMSQYQALILQLLG